MLVNKQLIKTGTNSVPNVYLSAITKKEGKLKFLADLQKIHKEYAQGAVELPSNSSVSSNSKNVKEKFSVGSPISANENKVERNNFSCYTYIGYRHKFINLKQLIFN